MKNIALGLVFLGLTQLGLVGCATVPDKSELQRLNGQELRNVLVGNTFTRRTDYGRWATYYRDGSSGVGRAWGTWGSETAAASYSISGDGELCETYSGDYEWSKPEHEYCMVAYTDSKGQYYMENTKDTWEPARVGDMHSFEIKSGDEYSLDE